MQFFYHLHVLTTALSISGLSAFCDCCIAWNDILTFMVFFLFLLLLICNLRLIEKLMINTINLYEINMLVIGGYSRCLLESRYKKGLICLYKHNVRTTYRPNSSISCSNHRTRNRSIQRRACIKPVFDPLRGQKRKSSVPHFLLAVLLDE